MSFIIQQWRLIHFWMAFCNWMRSLLFRKTSKNFFSVTYSFFLIGWTIIHPHFLLFMIGIIVSKIIFTWTMCFVKNHIRYKTQVIKWSICDDLKIIYMSTYIVVFIPSWAFFLSKHHDHILWIWNPLSWVDLQTLIWNVLQKLSVHRVRKQW